MAPPVAPGVEPDADCPLCPRLTAFRKTWRDREPEWFNSPVPTFGPRNARLLIVGLAPGLQGANRTGRPFTGDYAGVLLYDTLARYRFARGTYAAHPDDGVELIDCRITNAVRCVPPANRPLGAEVNNCRVFLSGELETPPAPAVVLPLGGIAHGSVLRALGYSARRYPFAHGALYRTSDGPLLAPSYHCSRYNLNTGRLTPAMLEAVFAAVRHALGPT